MLNITIASLLYSSLLAPSPAFVSKHISFNNCQFQKFTSILFLNQQKLYLKGSTFLNGLNSVVFHNQVADDHIILWKQKEISNDDQVFNQNQGDFAISIIECTFMNLKKKSPIRIQGINLSVYITQCNFYRCDPSENGGIIYLQRSRCLTITHTCSFQCKVKGSDGLLYYDCIDIDFSIFLYNTIAKTENYADAWSSYTIFCKSGSQYFRCNNITSQQIGAYQFDYPYCFNFAMNTVMDTNGQCMALTGYTSNNCTAAYDKKLTHVNFVNVGSDKPLFYIDLGCSMTITIEESLLFSQNVYIISRGNNDVSKNIKFIFINCVLNHGVECGVASYTDCKFQYYNELNSYITHNPHYTHGECSRPENNVINTKAHGCNAGNCIDTACDRTIGFPEGVIPYTTIVHTDLQTATFTPTKKFTFSAEFSKSSEFSNSEKFSNSKEFSTSSFFSNSDCFSKSEEFTKTGPFSTTGIFSESVYFSRSSDFSKSDDFLPTVDFNHTNPFTPSKSFTPSKKFSKSDEFSKTGAFSKTDGFTQTGDFSFTSEFSESIEFSKSSEFSNSKGFSKSDSFTRSNYFTKTDPFTKSDEFTKSSEFASSNQFSQSFAFSESNLFTQSQVANAVPLDSGKGNKLETGAIAGIAVGAAAACAIIAVVAFFLFKKFRPNVIDEEDIETISGNQNTTNTDNPIYNKDAEDDPFKEDF